ncbi:MAG: flagellar protein FlgN [Deltaproteobacteria bacterium]|nr:flagellar protein FlgN [Deltaproteobacteria bacterium]
MDPFKNLLHCLKAELTKQEEFLRLLTKERTAIVKCDTAELESTNVKKLDLINAAQELEKKRNTIISSLLSSEQTLEQIKLSEIVTKCPSVGTQRELDKIRSDLRNIVSAVCALNAENADLIKNSLGLVTSTLAIVQCAPGGDLPTYSKEGKLSSHEETSLKRSRTSA